MKASFVTVTPEMAADLLTRNFKNRKLNDSKVLELMEEFRAGRWNPAVGQAIMVDKFGNLTNGQHRLTMVVRLGEPVQMLVIYGVAEGTFWQVDQNFGQRSFGQRLDVEGYRQPSTLAAAVSAYMIVRHSLENKTPIPSNSGHIAPEAERLEVLSKTPSLQTWAVEVRNLQRTYKLGSAANIAGWAAVAEEEISTAGLPLLRTFVEKLHTFDMCPANGTVASARRALLETSATSRAGRARTFLILSRAWRAFAAGEELSMIRVDEKKMHISLPKRITR